MADPPLSRTPIPIPLHFHRAEAPFSCRRRGPARPCSLTPRPPVKSAGPVSRIFPRGCGGGAGGGGGGPERAWTRTLSVSPGTAGPLPPRSGVYDQSKSEPFFEQCFEKIGRLGRGSFGEVFKVRSRDDGRLYAVKRSVDRYRGEGDRARRLRESRCRATLGAHRNLLPLWGSWEEGGRLYLQTELCGGTLQQAAEGRGGPLEEGRVWGALADVLGGLKHLHDRHMAHMDVKPANIFIGPQGEHKLGDFGLLLPLRGPKRGEEQEGDPRYMAPELLDGVYTTAADVFSLGMSILEICSDLDIPRSGEGWQKLRQGYLPTEFLRGLSPELLEVLRAMLNPDHRQRASVDELLAIPAVKRAQRWRRGQLLLRWWLGWALAVWQYLLSALGHLWRGGFLPLFRLFLPRAPAPPSSPPPSALNDSSLYSDWWEASLGEDVIEPLADPPLTRAGNHRVDSTGPGSTADSITARSLGHTSTPRNLALDEDSGNRSPNLSFIGRDSPTLTPPPRGSLLPPSPAGDPLPPGRATFEPRNLLSLFDESVECN